MDRTGNPESAGGRERFDTAHQSVQHGDELAVLLARYREACPDPELSPTFMPGLWRRIEGQRADALSLFRRWAQIWVSAAVALALLMSAALIPSAPSTDSDVFYSGTYVDILAADHASNYADILPVADYE